MISSCLRRFISRSFWCCYYHENL